MNKKILIYLLFIIPVLVQAQKQKLKKDAFLNSNHLEIGLNVSGAVGTFVHNRTDSIYSDPYAILLKYTFNRLGIRMGAGYSFNTVKEVNAIQARVDGLNRLDLRFGIDHLYNINHHWRLYYGADILLGSVKGNRQFSEGDNIYQIDIDEKMIGFGPLLGIQYHITPRISLQTEASLYVMNSTTTKNYYNDARPDLKFSDRVSLIRIPPGIPRSIALVVRFR